MLKIVPLGPEEKGRELIFRYETQYYYDVAMTEGEDGWKAELVRRPFEKPVQKQFRDRLMGDWLEEPRVFAALRDGERVGYIELSHERWNNRMRVANLWVAEGQRRAGVGSRLMERAVEEAHAAGARALVLETQSCNHPAISFYRKMGFSLIGFDLTAYAQTDVEKKEVRLEFARPV